MEQNLKVQQLLNQVNEYKRKVISNRKQKQDLDTKFKQDRFNLEQQIRVKEEMHKKEMDLLKQKKQNLEKKYKIQALDLIKKSKRLDIEMRRLLSKFTRIKEQQAKEIKGKQTFF